jgi:hypothetical protein
LWRDYRAFQTLADRHNFPPDFPPAEAATGLSSMLLANPGFYAVVAEDKGRITRYDGDIAFFCPRSRRGQPRPRGVDRCGTGVCRTRVSVPDAKPWSFRWCLRGLRLVMQTTLMTIGLYKNLPEPISHQYSIEILASTDRFSCRATP